MERDVIESFFKSDLPLLFTGESGTGKSFTAKKAHEISSRQNFSFVELNCSAIPESIAETELFGSVAGAFTGATNRAGILEVADKGTLFLDEIGELPLVVQAKFLKFLDDGSFSRVGSTKQIKSDVRIICATNVDLKQKVKEKQFREDLFYRISVVPMFIKPLRERRYEIPGLVKEFISKKNKKITVKALNLIMENTWNGNIRQLFACLARACVLSKSSVISEIDIKNSLF